MSPWACSADVPFLPKLCLECGIFFLRINQERLWSKPSEVCMKQRSSRVAICIAAGVLVAATGVIIDLSMLPWERGPIMHQIMGDLMSGLVAALVALAIQLRNEESHYEYAIEKAGIVAELNHHVRNAVFPLFLAVQKNGDTDANRIASEAMERINIALKDATADAFMRRVDYGENEASKRAA
jgi:hypothetical protein